MSTTTAPTPPGNSAAPTAPNAQARMDAIVKVVIKACNAPGKGQSPPANIVKYLPFVMKALAEGGLTSKNQLAGMAATIYVELGDWLPREEEDGSAAISQPSGGMKYKGRGFIQITHDDNYRAVGNVLGIDLIASPEKLLDPLLGAKAGVVYWLGKLGNPAVAPFAESGDYQNVRSCINAGSPGRWGICHGKEEFKHAWDVLVAELPEGASPDIVGVAPGATFGVASCADGGSGASKSIVAPGASSQADALAYALGMHNLDIQKSHIVKLILNANAQPEILKLEAQQKFKLSGLGEEKALPKSESLGKTEKGKEPDDPIAQGQAGVKTDKRGGKLPEPDLTTPGNIPPATNNQPVANAPANTPAKPADPPHNDRRNNPIIRIKIGGVPTPSTPPPASSANSANGGNNAIANGLNGVSPNSPPNSTAPNSITAQMPGVADPARLASGGKVETFPTGKGAVGIQKLETKAIATPTELIFDSSKGDIVGRPRVASLSYQFNSTTVVLYDETGNLASEILKKGTLETEIGYEDGLTVNKFIGDIQKVTRIIPNKVEVFAIDRAAKAKATGTGATSPLSNTDTKGLEPAVQTALEAGKVKAGKGSTPVSTIAETANAVTPPTQNAPVPQKLGFVQPGNSQLDIATKEAAQKGSVIVSSGNQIKEVAPGQAESSGIEINYAQNPGLFLEPPRITKRNNFDLTSGFGTLTVKGYNPANKQVVAATIVSPSAPSQHPTGTIVAPEWGAVKLADPIIPGSRFTWGIATKDGDRVPESKAVMQGIVDICRYLVQWEKELNATFEITSWYRDPATNLRVASSGAAGPHTFGSAVDFYFEGMESFYNKMNDTWEYGVARKPGSFMHIDLVPGGRRRWSY